MCMNKMLCTLCFSLFFLLFLTFVRLFVHVCCLIFEIIYEIAQYTLLCCYAVNFFYAEYPFFFFSLLWIFSSQRSFSGAKNAKHTECFVMIFLSKSFDVCVLPPSHAFQWWRWWWWCSAFVVCFHCFVFMYVVTFCSFFYALTLSSAKRLVFLCVRNISATFCGSLTCTPLWWCLFMLVLVWYCYVFFCVCVPMMTTMMACVNVYLFAGVLFSLLFVRTR